MNEPIDQSLESDALEQRPLRPNRLLRWSLAGVVAAAGVALVVDATTENQSPARATGRSLPVLNNVAAIAHLVSLPKGSEHFATFSISCGWDLGSKHRIGSGTYRVNLNGMSFGLESNSGDPARGSVPNVDYATWSRYVSQHGWYGDLYLGTPSSLSNGPDTGTALCAGVF